jgi:SAM-dependent methyltransferase
VESAKYYAFRSTAYDNEPSRRDNTYGTSLRAACLQSLAFAHPPVSILLDLGAGTGRGLRELTQCDPNGSIAYVALDRSHEMLARCKAISADAERALHLVQADAVQVPFDGCSFDALWSFKLLPYIDHGAFAMEAARVMRCGASLLVTTVVKHEDDENDWRNSVSEGIHDSYPSRFHFAAEIDDSLATAGLQQVWADRVQTRRPFSDLRSEKADFWGEDVMAKVIDAFRLASPSVKRMYYIDDEGFTQHYHFGIYVKCQHGIDADA